MNEIRIGSFTFTDSDILSGEIVKEHSVIGESLAADIMTFTVHTTHTGNAKLLTKSLEWYSTVDGKGFVIADSDFNSISYATPVYFYVDGNLQGKFYATQITREGETTFTVECTSAVGLLITAKHYGGIYSGITASEILADILSGISYTLDATLANATISGYLPIATKRDNLQQVLFAIGGAVKTQSSGALEIVSMSNIVTSEIGAERIYRGGEVKKKDAYDGVQLTEHNFFQSGEASEVLYDDSIIGRQVITFNDPHYNIEAVDGSGNNILVYPTSTSVGTNYCVVGSAGVSSACTVTGKKYNHVQRIISEGTTTQTGNENIMQVTDAYLANPSIADTLAERLWAYAQCRNYITQDIIVADEVAGDMVKIFNPYSYESVKGIMTSFDMTLSGVNKARTEYLLDYIPEGAISGFSHYAMITGAGSWQKSGDSMTLTQDSGNWTIDGQTVSGTQTLGDVDKIRIILIGGGNGASNGTAGGAGGSSSWSKGDGYTTGDEYGGVPSAGVGGQGGNPGTAGQGGNIFEISINVANTEDGVLSVGSGGVGGASPTAGTSTTFTKGNELYSSSSGKKYPYGYIESKSGMTFASKGADGFKGGNGGDGGVTLTSATTKDGKDGESVNGHSGGIGGNTAYTQGDAYHPMLYYSGAGGGGASGTANGGNGGTYTSVGVGANGGNGSPATQYGGGGGAGHGGGGGGGGGVFYSWFFDYWPGGGGRLTQGYASAGGGAGGSAGTGGNGKQGCIIIYF